MHSHRFCARIPITSKQLMRAAHARILKDALLKLSVRSLLATSMCASSMLQITKGTVNSNRHRHSGGKFYKVQVTTIMLWS